MSYSNVSKAIHIFHHAPFENRNLFWLRKVLMEEQKMSILQRSQIESYLRRGEPLPQSKPKVSFKSKSTDCWPGADLMRPKSTKRRTLTAIKASGAHDRDKYEILLILTFQSGQSNAIHYYCATVIIQDRSHRMNRGNRRKYDCKSK